MPSMVGAHRRRPVELYLVGVGSIAAAALAGWWRGPWVGLLLLPCGLVVLLLMRLLVGIVGDGWRARSNPVVGQCPACGAAIHHRDRPACPSCGASVPPPRL